MLLLLVVVVVSAEVGETVVVFGFAASVEVGETVVIVVASVEVGETVVIVVASVEDLLLHLQKIFIFIEISIVTLE